LLENIPKPKFDKNINGSLRGTTETLPSGIDNKQSPMVPIKELSVVPKKHCPPARLGELLEKRGRSYQSTGRGTLKEKPVPSGIDKKSS